MKRAELYELVWSKPMTHVAKDFGMSDVAVRKHCVKHDIPTPPLGYWAKLAHGKTVKRPPLPTRQRASDELVDLSPRIAVLASPEAEAAQQAAEAERADRTAKLAVPAALPEKPHPLVRSVRAGLRKTKADAQGFVTLDQGGLPAVSVGRDSMDRVLRILQTVVPVAESLGYAIERTEREFFLKVDGEPFKLRIYAIRDQRPHTPTAKELRYQEEVDRDHARRPDLYPERKAYRSWDYFPSERLTLELSDTNSYRWGEHALIKRWRDRKGTGLEQRLAEAFVWLKPAAVLAREKRLEIEERDRLRAEKEARRERLRERKKKAEKAKDYLDKLVETHVQLERLDRMIAGLSGARKEGGEALARLLAEAEAYRRILKDAFDEPSVRSSLEEMGILGDEELVMPSLLEPMPPWSWQDS